MKSTIKKNNHSNTFLRRASRIFSMLICLMFVLTVFAVPALAAGENEEATGGLSNSDVVTGLKKMIADGTEILIFFCPLVGGAFAVYYLIRRSMSDEQDGKMWMRKVIMAGICGIGGGLVSGIIGVISGYFG